MGAGDTGRRTRLLGVATWACAATLCAAPAAAQTVRGSVVDASDGRPVGMAGVYLLDRDHRPLTLAVADSLGRYYLTVPDSGAYYLLAQRLGYMEVVSPLLAISDTRDYDLDLELRAEPIGLDPLTVTVRNEEFYRWWRFEFGGNPQDMIGFRLIQGARLEAARLRGADNTGMLRALYIPVTHGRQVCIGVVPRAVRGGWRRGSTEVVQAGGGARAAERSCGALYLDGRWIPNEHIESLDLSNVAVVAATNGAVYLFTRGFDWTFRGR